ncbi:AAA domain-containing protein [Rufibacter quisquiliarum]|uniref:Superfamily I DNA and/or RNA helicase n=1 Tax=Rufibacter quisquiliarum TaxID=1549639 RepID=A0A839GCL1_9BACT|nr:AAA domain-containing protein [Rufibacter quisquiliarum]MBA9077324.1 superfamily I DNA and/or RNA helicase [Rufibacter quisquiliarum]
MNKILDELLDVRALLKLEQEEERKQYQLRNAQTSITERKRLGICWYPVNVTKQEVGFGNKMVVELERTSGRDQLHMFQAGSSAALFTNGDGGTLNGVVLEVKRNKLRLATTKEDLPDWLEGGSRLGVELTFDEVSYREMEFALMKVMEADKTRLAQLRDILLGAEPAIFRKEKPYAPVPVLNNSQNEAVRNIMQAKDVAIIHGPPGTGKTTTLVQAILQTLAAGEKRLLVTAPSNTAVDLLTEKLAEQGVNVIRIGNPSRVSEVLLEHTLDAQIMHHRDYKMLKKLRKTAEEYKSMAHQFKRNFGPQERAQRQQLKEESKRALNQADDIEDYITDDLLENVQVITCTLVGSANRTIRHLQYDTVFIDEAAQALEPACWIPITRANRVVLAGDHYQLPPTVKSIVAERGGFSRTLFEKCIERQPETAVMLKTQYRMHEHIMGFSNGQFYGGELQAHESVKTATLTDAFPAFEPGPVVEFIDTAGCGFNDQTIGEGSSTANPEEADILIKHLVTLLTPYEPAPKDQPLNGKPLRIGVISPYRAQINYLTDQVEHQPKLSQLMARRQLSVGTVDSFQGQERDIIYISMVRSNPEGEIGFLADMRRMNVAMTRAKKKMVIVGDSATLGQHAFYQKFLAYAEQIGAYRSAWELISEAPQ